MIKSFKTVKQPGIPVFYKAECKLINKYGRVDACSVKHVKRYTSILNLQIIFHRPVDPDFVSSCMWCILNYIILLPSSCYSILGKKLVMNTK